MHQNHKNSKENHWKSLEIQPPAGQPAPCGFCIPGVFQPSAGRNPLRFFFFTVTSESQRFRFEGISA